MPVLLIVFIILLIIALVALALRKSKKAKLSQFCQSDSDCPSSDYCIPNPEMAGKTQCFPSQKKFCAINPPTSLVKCDPKDKKSCDTCLNNPAFGCVVVDDDHKYNWKQGDKKVQIPNSPPGMGWCLPNIENRDITCNPYTAEYVLEETPDGGYEWGCHCKYPNLFTKDGTDGDCLVVNACGGPTYPTKLVVPTDKKCKTDSECGTGKCLPAMNPAPCGYTYDPNDPPGNGLEPSTVCKDGNCYCHVPWAGDAVDKINPLSGRCDCGDKNFQCVLRASDYFEFNCVTNTCAPYPSKTKCKNVPSGKPNWTCCDCPPQTISCPDDIPIENKNLITYCQNNGAMCIDDPCAVGTPNNSGRFDPISGKCICPAPMTSVGDDSSPVGQRCADLCQANGPCSNRGTCYLSEDSDGKPIALCKDCRCPYSNDGTDKSCLCNGTTTLYKDAGEECCGDDECCSGRCINPDCYDKYEATKGKCASGSVHILPNDPKGCHPVDPHPNVHCDDKNSCPFNTTCCAGDTTGSWNCCPYKDGTCCDDKKHCCPSDYPICDLQNKACKSSDGNQSISWSDV